MISRENRQIEYVNNASLDELIAITDFLGLNHFIEQWIDDDYPDKEDELRVKLINHIERRI